MTTLDGSDLTERQREILDCIVEAVETRGFPPAVRDICDAVGLSSPSTVHAHLKTLEDLGYLRRDPSKPRAIEVRWEREVGDLDERPGVRNVPIYGSIAAGPTSLAEQTLEGILPVPKDFIGDTPHFALTIKGESMIGAGILDGDLVVVKAQADAVNGDIVAAQITGETGEAEATVKRFRRNGGTIELLPENPAMEPVPVPEDLRILGKVVAVIRKM